MRLPDLPFVELEVVGDAARGDAPFLDVRRLTLTIDGTRGKSAPFRYEVIERRALDAAVMVAHHEREGVVEVYLRSAIRPPVGLRVHPPRGLSTFWEVPAGLIEPGEAPGEAAVRELEEELGFVVRSEDLEALGSWAMPAPGCIGEVQHFFHVRVDPALKTRPPGDGSPLEADAKIVSVPLDVALDACRSGQIPDAKTELALRRLQERLRR